MKFSIKDFFSKFDQICSFLRIWSYLLKETLMGLFIFCAVVFLFMILLILTWGLRYSSKKREQQKTGEGGHWLWNRGYRHLFTFVFEVEETFTKSLFSFLLFFWWRKIPFENSLGLYFHPYTIEFFWFATVQNREKDSWLLSH